MSAVPSGSRALPLTLFVLHGSHDRKLLESLLGGAAFFGGCGLSHSVGKRARGTEQSTAALQQACGKCPGLIRTEFLLHLPSVITGYHGMESGCASLAFGIET